MGTAIKQDRSRRAGHKHSLNAQDFEPTQFTPEQRRYFLRGAARTFVAMIDTWGDGTLLESEAMRAAERLAGVLDTQLTNGANE